jgi:hypothetical protein
MTISTTCRDCLLLILLRLSSNTTVIVEVGVLFSPSPSVTLKHCYDKCCCSAFLIRAAVKEIQRIWALRGTQYDKTNPAHEELLMRLWKTVRDLIHIPFEQPSILLLHIPEACMCVCGLWPCYRPFRIKNWTIGYPKCGRSSAFRYSSFLFFLLSYAPLNPALFLLIGSCVPSLTAKQGTDPATDFRGMGLLSLMNLIYFAERMPALTRQILNEGRAYQSLFLSLSLSI